MSASPHAEDKNAFIEMWRGISVLLVVYFHFSSRVPPSALGVSEAPAVVNDIGKLGVYLFFIISGFLIAKSMEASKSLADFYAKRLSRIWPLFIVAGIVVFVFMKFLSAPAVTIGLNKFNTSPAGMIDLFMTSFFFKDIGFRWVDGVFWSVLVELKFYFYIGLFAVVFKKRYIEAFCATAIILGSIDFLILLYDRAGDLRFTGANQLRFVSEFLHGALISHYLPFFAVGVALYRNKFDGLFNALCVLCAFAFLIAISEDQQFETVRNAQFLLILAIGLALDQALLKARIVLWLGKYSYSLYLFHQMIGLAVIAAIAPRVGINIAIVLVLALVLFVSWFFSQLFEWRYRRPVARGLLAVFNRMGLDKLAVSFPETKDAPTGKEPRTG